MTIPLASYQKQFNYSAEELDSVLRVLGENARKPSAPMGDDTPFAVLSSQPRIIYDYFRHSSRSDQPADRPAA
ncbi:Glutamate synthase [NADPH] large chain precursor [Raoultella terrigena]|uniref:Glutamate synthase [NADPH] large chain n=1 Tax=Raoultella terrigena TaxID=577 RepID=A0A4U9D460_RAOTE|nr:Glutamate synthase [NADPH] large chain precursor [Raoultella terrigena]